MFRQHFACHPQGALMVLAKITIKHERSSSVRGVAAYLLPEDDMQNAVETCWSNSSVLNLLVRAGRSIGLRCVCEECGRPMYRPISFKLYSSRTLHRMLEVFTRLQRAPHLVP